MENEHDESVLSPYVLQSGRRWSDLPSEVNVLLMNSRSNTVVDSSAKSAILPMGTEREGRRASKKSTGEPPRPCMRPFDVFDSCQILRLFRANGRACSSQKCNTFPSNVWDVGRKPKVDAAVLAHLRALHLP